MSTLPSNVSELLDALGDPRAINTAIGQAGYRPPSAGSIRIWRHRRIIPARWHLPIVRAAELLAPHLPSKHIEDLVSTRGAEQ